MKQSMRLLNMALIIGLCSTSFSPVAYAGENDTSLKNISSLFFKVFLGIGGSYLLYKFYKVMVPGKKKAVKLFDLTNKTFSDSSWISDGEYIIDESYKTLNVNNPFGGVTVSTGKDTFTKISIKESNTSLAVFELKHYIQNLILQIEVEGSTKNKDDKFHLDIKIPKGVGVGEINSFGGNVSISGITSKGGLYISSSN